MAIEYLSMQHAMLQRSTFSFLGFFGLVMMTMSCQKTDYEETELEHQLPPPEIIYVVDCEAWGLNVGDSCTVDFGSAGEVQGTLTSSCECDVIPPCNLTASATSTPDNGGFDGSASVNTTGGFGPLNYDWSIGQTVVGQSQSIEGLVAGEYVIVVTDTSGCVASDSVLVEGQAPAGGLLTAQLVNGSSEDIPVTFFFSEPALPSQNTTVFAPPGIMAVSFSVPLGTTQCFLLISSECNGETLTDPHVLSGSPPGSMIVDEVFQVAVGCPGVVDSSGGGG